MSQERFEGSLSSKLQIAGEDSKTSHNKNLGTGPWTLVHYLNFAKKLRPHCIRQLILDIDDLLRKIFLIIYVHMSRSDK
jgi:hypothetical protein